MLNANDILDVAGGTVGAATVRIIVHEAAHTFYFLHQEVSTPNVSEWPVQVERDALELAQRYRLVGGIESVWTALHQTGVEEGIASNWSGDAWNSPLPTEQAARAKGFSTAYGASAPIEDFSETVMTAALRPTDSGICHAFTGQDRVTPEIAILYAKTVFATSLGAISEADFTACVGSTAFATTHGIELNGVVFDENNHAEKLG